MSYKIAVIEGNQSNTEIQVTVKSHPLLELVVFAYPPLIESVIKGLNSDDPKWQVDATILDIDHYEVLSESRRKVLSESGRHSEIVLYDGLQVAKSLREKSKLASLYILGVTANVATLLLSPVDRGPEKMKSINHLAWREDPTSALHLLVQVLANSKSD